ncbi:hypothetical protein BV509_04475 [Rhodovulum sulfidophilum]|uniref:Flagellar biosynthesis protein n=1 Tax=Rhodovulum visakhapatnamense TaxID=364297 RepID=A0ABS1REP6_9RHOB|nr:hypothetical protein [Rhodovulum visakhapatnamense]MBL3568947.1 flagellar biosynthesis protein [Rhodovulum visakhapatnamense]MBL3578122.1 flagellar biosynthesis protein [Rhodovulum visakhapatnamense]OLS43660.1 hypothetical protein BV509_04475 [Rhodovulum sulfidophilum]
MSRLLLEDFSNHGARPRAGREPDPAPVEDTQQVRLDAYEEGYRAGWDDATAAEAESRARIGADFEKTLQELSFSYHEARTHVMEALEPLLTAMVDRVLPDLARQGFARKVVEIALELAEAEANTPLQLRVCPENRDALEELAGADPGLPLQIVDDATLGPGQALLRGGAGEREIDIDGMLAAIRSALNDFMTTEEEARRHG